VRSQANIARMPAERANLQRQLTDAQAYVDQVKGMHWPPPGLLSDALAKQDQIQAKLKSTRNRTLGTWNGRGWRGKSRARNGI
jgi:hypothetical protein